MPVVRKVAAVQSAGMVQVTAPSCCQVPPVTAVPSATVSEPIVPAVFE
jgi:hypothetical protein